MYFNEHGTRPFFINAELVDGIFIEEDMDYSKDLKPTLYQVCMSYGSYSNMQASKSYETREEAEAEMKRLYSDISKHLMNIYTVRRSKGPIAVPC